MHFEKKRAYPVLFLGATLIATFFLPDPVLADQYFTRYFEWSYKGSTWTWTCYISKSLYNEYSQVSLYKRTRNGVEGYDFLVTTQDNKVKEIADGLHEAASEKGYEPYDEVSFVLAFVQSLPYTSDSVTTGHDEYPRFPIETLVDGGGDCEDTSILFATLVLILDYSAILIELPDHLAVGVWGTDLPGSYYEYNDRQYYYCETTGNNWKIGDIPSAYQDVGAYLNSIDVTNQYIAAQDEPSQPDTPSQEDGDGNPALRSLAGLVILFVVCVAGVLFSVAYLTTRPKKAPTPPAPPTVAQLCPSCSCAIPQEAVYCPYCGKALPQVSE